MIRYPADDPIVTDNKIVTFGELMLRLSPNGFERLFQSDRLCATFGGSEANVALSLAQFGKSAAFVTKLPENPIADAAIRTLRGHNVDTDSIVFGGERMGIYFLEKGVSLRAGQCVYDRKGSAIANARRSDFDWKTIFHGANRFHFSGITPALGGELPQICTDACRVAKDLGIRISCDLNYRSKLWRKDEAQKVMSELCSYVDLLIANVGSAKDVFGIEGKAPSPYGSAPNPENMQSVAEALKNHCGCSTVALTGRTVLSASENRWSGMLYDKQAFFSKEYHLQIVDRVGGGDSFAAGLIYALQDGQSPQDAIEFAVAASALCHTVEGDFNRIGTDEVWALVRQNSSGILRR